MAKDYKHRIRGKNTLLRQDFDPVKSLSVWKWMLITSVAIAVVVLIVYVSSVGLKNSAEPDDSTLPDAQLIESKKTPDSETATPVKPEVKAPQFDFYTILSGKEVVVPEYELKTRTRENRIGQAKSTQYVMQAGSYNARKDAEQMHTKLAAMGIESKIEKAKIGSTFWYRIKMGPFTQIDIVNNINARLKQNGIDAIVTETSK